MTRPPPGRRQAANSRRKFGQRPGEDVGDEHVGLHRRSRFGKMQIEPCRNAVAFGIAAAGNERLLVVVDADDARAAELERRDGEHTGAASRNRSGSCRKDRLHRAIPDTARWSDAYAVPNARPGSRRTITAASAGGSTFHG